MSEHVSYETLRGHPHDFEVAYEALPAEKNKVGQSLFQSIRCDFKYEDDPDDTIWMIWPEFLDKNGNLVLDTQVKIDDRGTAKMWIINPAMREEIHRKKAKVGGKGYFVVGQHKIAQATITKIVGLPTNPNTMKSKNK
jgi:hypothetical protein